MGPRTNKKKETDTNTAKYKLAGELRKAGNKKKRTESCQTGLERAKKNERKKELSGGSTVGLMVGSKIFI